MIRITAPHFCAGAIVETGIITRTAPILRYMTGWMVEKAVRYATGKGWRVEVLCNQATTGPTTALRDG